MLEKLKNEAYNFALEIIDIAKKNGNAKQMFFSMCNQRGINPNDILSLINGSNQ